MYGYIAIAVVAAAVIAIGLIMASNWLKAEPNEVLILTGRKHLTKDATGKPVKRGWRMVTGGGILRIPIMEKVNRMSLLNMNIPDLTVTEAYSSQGVPVTIVCVVNFKVSSVMSMLELAIENFLGQSHEKLKQVVQETMEGQLRDIMGTLTVEKLYQNREAFIGGVHQQASEELAKIGLVINNINIQSISDPRGYLDALGRTRTAEVIKDAQIGEANAEKESTIQTETAKKEAAIVKADQEKQTAEAEKERDVAEQNYHGETIKATETANQQGPLAQAEARKAVVKAEQGVKETEELARKDVEAAKALADAQLYNATTVVPEEARKQAAILKAEGMAESVKREAGGEAERVRMTAYAAADGKKADMVAEGEGIKAKLVGEADGTKEMADAMNAYQESSKLQITLNAIVEVAKAGAVTLDNFVPEKVIAFDGSGGGNNGNGTLSNLATVGPIALAKFIESAGGAMGIDLMQLVGKLNPDVVVDPAPAGDTPEGIGGLPKTEDTKE